MPELWRDSGLILKKNQTVSTHTHGRVPWVIFLYVPISSEVQPMNSVLIVWLAEEGRSTQFSVGEKTFSKILEELSHRRPRDPVSIAHLICGYDWDIPEVPRVLVFRTTPVPKRFALRYTAEGIIAQWRQQTVGDIVISIGRLYPVIDPKQTLLPL